MKPNSFHLMRRELDDEIRALASSNDTTKLKAIVKRIKNLQNSSGQVTTYDWPSLLFSAEFAIEQVDRPKMIAGIKARKAREEEVPLTEEQIEEDNNALEQNFAKALSKFGKGDTFRL